MSIASQTTMQNFPFRYEEVFDGLIKILPALNMNIKSQDTVIGRITVVSTASAFSWGEHITLILEKVSDTSTSLRIESSLRFGGSLAGSHKHQNNFDYIISTLSQHLSSPTGKIVLPTQNTSLPFLIAIAVILFLAVLASR